MQSPQFFEVSPRRNWLEHGAASVQEYFYRWVMPARDVRGSSICVGTNAVYRRTALQVTDGGALVENSEDVHTGFNLMCVGYRTQYVPVVLAGGVCPDNLQTFFNQQHRWCSGSMSLLFSRKFWSAPIPLRAKLTFIAGMTYYIYTALAIIVAPLPPLLMVCLYPDDVRWSNYLLLAPSLLQAYLFLPLWHRLPYGFSAYRTKMICAWAHLFALADRLRGRPLSWTPSGQSGEMSRTRRMQLVRSVVVLWPLAMLAGSVAGCAAHMSSPADTRFWPVLVSELIFAGTAAATLAPLRTAAPPTAQRLGAAATVRPAQRDPALSRTVTPAGPTRRSLVGSSSRTGRPVPPLASVAPPTRGPDRAQRPRDPR